MKWEKVKVCQKYENNPRRSRLNKQSVDKSIQRIRNATQAKEITKIMADKGISRQKAQKICLKENTPNSSSMIEKNIKANNENGEKEKCHKDSDISNWKLKNSQEINESNKNYVQNSDSLIISKEIIIKKLSENSQLIEKKENKSIK